MGSVITYNDKCPKCEQETGFSDFYYKNGEDYFACQNSECGFSYSYMWKRDKDHKLVTIDGSDNYEFSNLIMVETVFENGVKKNKELKQEIWD